MTNSSNNTTMPSPGGAPAPAATPEPTPTGYGEPAAKVETPESTVDDFGYTKEPAATPEPEAAKVETPVEPEAGKVSTGYGEGDPVPEPAKVEPEVKPDGTDAEKLLQFEIKEALGEISDNYDKETIGKFAEDNKLTKDQVKAYVELTKQEDAANLKSAEDAKVKQRSDWGKELREDSTFGGDDFNKNVERVEKVLENYLPNMKKALTDRGSMLPPYIMRDLLSLSKTLNPTTTLVSGTASTPAPKEEGNFLDDMYN